MVASHAHISGPAAIVSFFAPLFLYRFVPLFCSLFSLLHCTVRLDLPLLHQRLVADTAGASADCWRVQASEGGGGLFASLGCASLAALEQVVGPLHGVAGMSAVLTQAAAQAPAGGEL